MPGVNVLEVEDVAGLTSLKLVRSMPVTKGIAVKRLHCYGKVNVPAMADDDINRFQHASILHGGHPPRGSSRARLF